MANSVALEKGLAQAIKVIAGTRVENIKRDKTVRATINRCVRDNCYDVIYNGGHIYAYAEGGAVYMPNSSVYVSIPKGDLSSKKTIIGLTSSSVAREDDMVGIASARDNYTTISENILGSPLKNKIHTLETYHKYQTIENLSLEFQDIITLYEKASDSWDSLNNEYNIKPSSISVYANRADAILLSGEFKTSFAKEQINSDKINGNYGLIITYSMKNNETTYKTINEQWNAIEPTTKITVLNTQQETIYKRLKDYKLTDDNCWNHGGTNGNPPTLQKVQETIQNIKAKLDAFILEANKNLSEEANNFCQLYSEHLQQLLEYELNNEGNQLTSSELKQLYLDWFNTSLTTTGVGQEIFRYDFDINQMVGDPYRFNTGWSYQYCIIPIEEGRFDSIDGIYFFCQNFKPEFSDPKAGKIKLRNLQLFFLDENTDEEGDYVINFVYPSGYVFYSTSPSETLEVQAFLNFQKVQDLTSTTSFAWFKQDLSVTGPESPYYNSWAKKGWRQIGDKGRSINSRIFTAEENKAYENFYLCIAMRGADVIINKSFKLVNLANKRDIKIISDSGTSFDQTIQQKNLICTINDKTENFDDIYSDNQFRFNWSSHSDLLDVQYNKTKTELETELANSSLTNGVKSSIRAKLAAIAGISWNHNYLVFSNSQISTEHPVTVTCEVELTEDGNNYFKIGEASLTLTEQEIATLRSYRIDIINSGQVFQYNEAGISPCSEIYEQPYEIKPLTCNFYSPSGVLVDSNQYTVEWQFPKERSLIVPEVEIGDDKIYSSLSCPFSIAEEYDFDALENQIVCIVNFDGNKYYQQTNFFFGKIGENGTNATDIVAKISPIENATYTVFKDEPLILHVYPDKIFDDSGNEISPNENHPQTYTYKWNTGNLNTDASLKLELYRRNELIDSAEYKSIKWSIAGTNQTFKTNMSIEESTLDNDSSVVAYVKYEYTPKLQSSYFTNYIVKGEAALEIEDASGNVSQQKYYAYYPIYVIVHEKNNISYSVGIDKSDSLRQVMYTADGRAPQFSTKQGIKVLFTGLKPEDSSRILQWSVCGGVNYTSEEGTKKVKEGEQSPFLNIVDPSTGNLVKSCVTEYLSEEQIATQIQELQQQKQETADNWKITSRDYLIRYNTENDSDAVKAEYTRALDNYLNAMANYDEQIAQKKKKIVNFVQIKPVDAYDGETSNHYVKVEIYKKTNNEKEYTIYAPIHLYLNQYGLSSVNSWDGNSIEINEDEKYVLAPQVGAGRKNVEDNTFTGLVMGVEKTYNQQNKPETSVGLLGYNHGKQSIWLDAETGNATFGLPEDDAVDAGNPLTEGRVELRPGGISRISRWRFDSRSLYRVVSKSQTNALHDSSIDYHRTYTSPTFGNEDNFELLGRPYQRVLTHLKNPRGEYVYSQEAPRDAHGSIPHDQQGILLSAAPAYASFKGRPLTENDDIDFTDANTDVSLGDTFEVEINPNIRSVFGIYNHMRKRDENNNIVYDSDGKEIWFRILKAGIDGSGRFFSNALKDQTTTAIIGYLGGFGVSAQNRPYIGASWDIDRAGTLIKMFTPVNDLSNVSPLYISSSTNIENKGDEGLRPIGIYSNEYTNIFVGDNDNEIIPEKKITALKLNHKNNTIILGTSSDNNDKIDGVIPSHIDEQTQEIIYDNPEKAELKLTYKNDIGHLLHTRGWRTHIGGAYTGLFKNTYDQTIDGLVTRTYKSNSDNENHWSLLTNIYNSSKINLNSTGNSNNNFTMIFGQENSWNQKFILTKNSNGDNLSFYQTPRDSEQYYYNKVEASKDGIIIGHQHGKNIKILSAPDRYQGGTGNDAPYIYRLESSAARARNISDECGIILSSLGVGGIGLYAETQPSTTSEFQHGYSDSYVSFRMEPSGANSAFYFQASGQERKIYAATGQNTVAEGTLKGTGSYLFSDFLTFEKAKVIPGETISEGKILYEKTGNENNYDQKVWSLKPDNTWGWIYYKRTSDQKILSNKDYYIDNRLPARQNTIAQGIPTEKQVNKYSLSGVTIGPNIFTPGMWINSVLGLDTTAGQGHGSWADTTGLYVSHDIRTEKDLMVNENVYIGNFSNKNDAAIYIGDYFGKDSREWQNNHSKVKIMKNGDGYFDQRVTATAFTGNGKLVTNTTDNEDGTIQANGAGAQSLGQPITITIPKVQISQGRPTFGTSTINFTYNKMSKNDILSALGLNENDLNNIRNFNNHYHNITNVVAASKTVLTSKEGATTTVNYIESFDSSTSNTRIRG